MVFLTVMVRKFKIYLGSDGHKAAKAARAQFPIAMEAAKEIFQSNMKEGFQQVFNIVNEILSNDSTWDSYLSGTTAVLALVIDGKTHVAHVGDSRAVIIHQQGGIWNGTQLTRFLCDYSFVGTILVNYQRKKNESWRKVPEWSS